ncbi:hypothetical protein F6R98_00225 [Candidatus Methylospira mobilis]|uniref:Uncharacterized protein n=1 Tax=Candidatus Methylospira mobilis TaxID=1808979 RepID=A0A5Q0BCK5_9GAMM|nr:hypothetical protein [Candidatus Methylospira mobilis]QFY41229.1 hypothetical protein F6R98_00225 [Candidatus Methylospira mobilis]WNV05552.1 hypothetical protein RP726_03825 [Candidatus Methylospira mobilis]
MTNKKFDYLFGRLAIITFIALISGCNDGVSVGTASVSGTQTRLGGHVLNDDGPIDQGRVEAKDAQGHIAAQTELKGQSTYAMTLPTGTLYPLVLTVYPEAAPNDALSAVVTDPSASMQDISPVTTIVVNTALSLGGFTETNLAKAAGAAIAQRKKSGGGGGGGAATTSESFKGDATKQYGGWH